MDSQGSVAIVMRYRDLVTELGGTLAEHRKIMRHHGFVWWGWWRRQAERVPKTVLSKLFSPNNTQSVPMILFDSGTLKLYGTTANKAVVAPSLVGIQTPQVEATPEYYVRGRFSVWFRLEKDITPINVTELSVIARPTQGDEFADLESGIGRGVSVTLEQLRDDRPTLWLAKPLETRVGGDGPNALR